MPIDQRLAARVRQAIGEQASLKAMTLREKHMFGGLAFMLNDKMACGVIDVDLMVRVGPAAYADALSHDHVRPMDFTGRPMRGYVFVGPAAVTLAADLDYWIELATTNIEALTAGQP